MCCTASTTAVWYIQNEMMPGLKGLSPHELAHKWVKDLGTRPRYEHKSEMIISRYANIGVGLWECVARNNP